MASKPLPASRRPYVGYDPCDGQSVLFVPLGRNGGAARIFKDDYARLIAAGVSPYWFLARNSGTSSYVRAIPCGAGGGATHVTIARVLLNAGAGQKVCYRDRDPLNLRNDNLHVDKGYARRRDADIMPPPEPPTDNSNAPHGHAEAA